MSKERILIVEDDADIREGVRILLESEDYMVDEAEDGREGLENLRDDTDLVILDIMMPVKNGYEAARLIRSLDREDAKTIPIIAMTANAFTEDRIRAKEAGMDEHVAKPVDVELLLKVIHKLVK